MTTPQVTREATTEGHPASITGDPRPPADLIVEALVTQAHAAQREIDDWSEEQIDAAPARLATSSPSHAHSLAVATVAETGMGNVHDKTLKNSIASSGIYRQLAGASGTAKPASTANADRRDRQPRWGHRRPGAGNPPGGHVHFQGVDRAQRPKRHHPQSQPTCAGRCRNRSAGCIQQGTRARWRAHRPGAVASEGAAGRPPPP